MSIFSIFTLLGGLAFFLYGMSAMSSSLEKMSGGKLERMLKEMTSTPFKSMMFGAAVTVAIQSSSALTVMLVGLVNSGIMALEQTIGVLMGSNIGTTLTAWILSLAGIESDSFLLMMLKPSNFAPLLAFVGIVMNMSCKKEIRKETGKMLIGFSILMMGMTMMSDSCAPLAEMPEFTKILTMFNNPLLGLLVGTLFTGLIQSSAASIGILQALSLTGGISFRMAIPIVFGLNIGTCVTALLSSIGVNKNAKRVSVVHITIKIIGAAFGLVVFYGSDMLLHYAFMNSAVNPIWIAIIHSVFNIANTVLLMPFSKQLVAISELIIKDDHQKVTYELLDERLLNSPSLALEESYQLTKKMFSIAQDSVKHASFLVEGYNEKSVNKINENEEKLDMFEDKLDSFLVRLSGQNVADAEAREIFKMLHSISDIERLGDHACNIIKLTQSMNEKAMTFSVEAQYELVVLTQAVEEIVDITVRSFGTNDAQLAKEIEPLEEVVDYLVSRMKKHHILRLQREMCTLELGYILSDILNNFERMSDHCSNIGLSIIEATHKNSFDSHEYVSNLRSAEDEEFNHRVEFYKEKYSL